MDKILTMFDPIIGLKDKLPQEFLDNFNDIVTLGFKHASYERQDEFRRSLVHNADTDLRKYLFKLRQTWLYIVYSSPSRAL